jgi:membrane protein YqaA with SNARE-associated domain
MAKNYTICLNRKLLICPADDESAKMLPGTPMATWIAWITVSSAVTWVRRLGGPGLILLGVADNSVVPLAGSMDVLTIYLAASHPAYWFYYAGMATLGAVIGGYITYRLARKGGKEALGRKLGEKRVQGVYKRFERWGFWSVALPAILPPPFPIVPFLLAAGAMQYSRRNFLAALTLGRAVRFTIVASLGAIYGRRIVGFFSQYYRPALLILVALAVAGGAVALYQYLRHTRKDIGRRPVRPAA